MFEIQYTLAYLKDGLSWVRSLNEPFEIVAELKYDGTSISLTYEKGRLTRAVTRGDGTRGDDVTANIKTIRSVPLRLRGSDFPEEFEIRGEVLLPWAEFDRLNTLYSVQGGLKEKKYLRKWHEPRASIVARLRSQDGMNLSHLFIHLFII